MLYQVFGCATATPPYNNRARIPGSPIITTTTGVVAPGEHWGRHSRRFPNLRCDEHRHGELAGISGEIEILRDRHQHPVVLLAAICEVQSGPRASVSRVQASRHQCVGVAASRAASRGQRASQRSGRTAPDAPASVTSPTTNQPRSSIEPSVEAIRASRPRAAEACSSVLARA